MTMAIINTLVPVKTFTRSTLAVALTTKAITPTGGKTSPIDTIMIDKTPNQMGSNPRRVMSGNVNCKVRRRRGSHHEHAHDKITDHNANDDDPAVEVHIGDHRNNLLRHPAQCHKGAEDGRADDDHEDHGARAYGRFQGFKHPVQVRRPKATPMAAAMKAPMAPTSVGVTTPV